MLDFPAGMAITRRLSSFVAFFGTRRSVGEPVS
jgi:hypothetical protein